MSTFSCSRPLASFPQGLTHWERSDEGVSYATLNVFVTLSRKPGFYLWNVALPLCFLITLAFISVFLPAEDLPNRLQITLTLLLTLVAFKFVVSQYLPATSYQTWLDLYVTSGFTLLFVLAAQNWIVYILDREYPEEDTAKNFNRISAYVLIAGWGLLHAVVAVLVVLVLRARERHAVEDDGNVWGDRQEVDLPASEPLYALRVMQQEAGAACKAGQA